MDRDAGLDPLPGHQGEVRIVDGLLQVVRERVADQREVAGIPIAVKEDLEEEVDNYLQFVGDCHATTSQDVKKWLKRATA